MFTHFYRVTLAYIILLPQQMQPDQIKGYVWSSLCYQSASFLENTLIAGYAITILQKLCQFTAENSARQNCVSNVQIKLEHRTCYENWACLTYMSENMWPGVIIVFQLFATHVSQFWGNMFINPFLVNPWIASSFWHQKQVTGAMDK